jgi:NTE family protein
MDGEWEKPTVGLVLSSGGARGAAHIGVLKVLEEHQIPIDLVVGSSIGAIIGGAYAAGVPASRIEEAWRKLDLRQVARSLRPTLPLHGWSSGQGLRRFLEELVGDQRIEELPISFAAVATDLETGERVILKEGSLVEAIRASSSIPGLFVPVEHSGRFLADGGLVSPLPVDVARELGAAIVVAVDVNLKPKRLRPQEASPPAHARLREQALRFVEEKLGGLMPEGWTAALKQLSHEEQAELHRAAPGILEALGLAIMIFVRRLVELTLELAPPDVLIAPEIADPSIVGTLSYRQAQQRIALGEAAAREQVETICKLLEIRTQRRDD